MYEISQYKKACACVNCDDLKDKDGYIAVFVETNRWPGHVSLFVGRSDNKNRILYDPCGSYKKGAGYNMAKMAGKDYLAQGEDGITWPDRPSSDVFSNNDFSTRDYYLYHEGGGTNLNAYAFEISKSDEEEIRRRLDELPGGSCEIECVLRVKSILEGIGHFKKFFSESTPSSFRAELKCLTRMPSARKRKDVIKRMAGEI
jgi:hypothetical protein